MMNYRTVVRLVLSALLVALFVAGCGGSDGGGVALDLATDYVELYPGETRTVALSVTPTGGFGGSIDLKLQEVDGDPAPAWIQLNPGTVNVSGATTVNLTLQATASAAVGSYPLRVVGGGGVAPFTLRVVPALGSRWREQTRPTSQTLNGITWNSAGSFLAVGAGGSAFYSTDNGQTWQDRSLGTGDILRAATPLDATAFLAVGYNRAIWIIDVAAWTGDPRGPGGVGYLYGIAHGNGVYVTVGMNGDVYTSADGGTWNPQAGLGVTLNAVIYDGARFVAVGGGGTVVTSSDGSIWTPLTSPGTASLEGIAYGDGAYVAVDVFGRVHTSPDGGTTWTSWDSGAAWLYDVAFGEGVFVVVGANGAVFTSNDDGVHWTPRGPGGDSLFDVAYGNGHFVVVGENGRVLTSP